MNTAQEVLYDVGWQTRRLHYLQGWETETGTRLNISGMLNYISKAQGRYWKFIRVWRCRNMVNYALRSAERYENAAGIKLIKVFQRGLEIEYNRYRGSQTRELFKPFNWRKISVDLTSLYFRDREMFKQLQVYSESRLYHTGKQHPTDPAAAPELAKFVRLMRDVVFDNG